MQYKISSIIWRSAPSETKMIRSTTDSSTGATTIVHPYSVLLAITLCLWERGVRRIKSGIRALSFSHPGWLWPFWRGLCEAALLGTYTLETLGWSLAGREVQPLETDFRRTWRWTTNKVALSEYDLCLRRFDLHYMSSVYRLPRNLPCKSAA